MSGPSYTEVFGGADSAGAGTGGQFSGVNLATATLVDGSYTIKPRVTLQNGGTLDFPARSFTTTNSPGYSSLIKRSSSPQISVYTGNARIAYTDWNDLAAGYGSQPPYIIVPTPFWNSLGAAPADGSLIRKAGSVQIWKYKAATNSKYAYQGIDDLSNAYPTGIPPISIVPTAYVDGLAISTT